MALLHFLRWPNEPGAKYNSHFCVGVLRRTFRAAPGQENSHFRVGVLRRTFEDTRGWADFVEGAHWSSNPAWGPDPAWEFKSSFCQDQPGAARCSQEQLGAARTSQEQPGAARGSQEQPGAARSSKEQPGAARSSKKQPEAEMQQMCSNRVADQEPWF